MNNEITDEENLVKWFQKFYPEEIPFIQFDLMNFVFSTNLVKDLDSLRNRLCVIEEKFQINKIEHQISYIHAPKSQI
jgi:hypothetical protein